jgi:FkbM family methyltransferase
MPVAYEPDPDNFALLQHNLDGHQHVEAVNAAVVGEDVTQVDFRQVVDKARDNSGGGSCARDEPGTVLTQVPAVSAVRLWREKNLSGCDLLKLDCEGSEIGVLRALADAELLGGVRLIVGEWHANDDRPASHHQVRAELAAILAPTHEVTFSPDQRGREGHFRAYLHSSLLAAA